MSYYWELKLKYQQNRIADEVLHNLSSHFISVITVITTFRKRFETDRMQNRSTMKKQRSKELLISFIIFLQLANPMIHVAAVSLPGLDVLSSGFDAASWTSKSRIFDLEGGEQTVHIESIDKTFESPSFVSVVRHGAHAKRVEESCVGVYTHFSEFVQTYQSSVSFDIGVSLGPFSLGVSAHRDVKKVHEAIIRRGQAIGISESWWGLYDVTLPPPFLMTSKFSTLFKQTISYLRKIGTPKTEEEQMIYNQVCCGAGGFGTHYVGSAIVGGRAKITNFVNSSYHKEHSMKTVSSQVSIGFQYMMYNLSLSSQSKKFEEKLQHDFRNNSNQVISYQPDMKKIHSSQAPWVEWEKAVSEHPTVVNTSVSSIANLFFDTPDVMKHMQRTIDFYLKHSKQPRLTDVRRATNNQLRSSNSNYLHKTVPGLSVVGCGFDATTLSSKTCLFDHALSKSRPHSTWSNPYYPDIAYKVPYGFFATNTPESTIVNSTIIMNTIDDYIRKSIYIEHHHHSGFLGLGSKDETKTTRKYYRNFYAHNYKLALTLRQISWYTLRLIEFPLPMYSKPFKTALNYLPDFFDPINSTNVAIFRMFFESFGTDVVTTADMGGMVWAENWFESCLSKVHSETCITDEVRRGWWFVHKHSSSRSCDKRIVDDFKKYSEHHYEMLGGTSGRVQQKDWGKWVLSVKYDPRPVKYTIAPIYHLLPDSHPKKKALTVATYTYLRESQDGRQKIIDSLEAIRPPPPIICKKIRNGENIANSLFNVFAAVFSTTIENSENYHTENGVSENIVWNAENILCPIVGYHGKFCPVEYQNAMRSVNNRNRQLPNAVGITIDVTTGELKLPAINYDGSAGTWTDPLSGDVYDIPGAVSLTVGQGVESENVPIIRIFKTEEQLASVWKSGYKNGNWLGGEFGKSKSILNLYEKFFSQQQATSISQHPFGLYKLALTENWEYKLNRFVKTALRSLPKEYDSDVYDRFMDTWGTHVAKNTLVGGMLEQQVIMKNCLWKSPYLSGGLSDSELRAFLKMELKKLSPRNSFYRERRKMHIDHRIGGNPEISDDKLWRRTLSQNPALLKIYAQVDWATVARKSNLVSLEVINNLYRSLIERMKKREAQRTKEEVETKRKRLRYLQGPRSVVAIVAHGRRGYLPPSMERGKYITLKGFSECYPGLSETQSNRRCNTDVYINSWNRVHLRKPLRYERNSRGDMRSVRCSDLTRSGQCITHHGPWVRTGCSLQPYANGKERPFDNLVPSHTVVAMVCAGCHVMTSSFPHDSKLRCVCPGY